jgi:antitoxin CptB
MGAETPREAHARRRARLRWRCRRGMLELDLLLTRFVERHYETLDPAERLAFERLLETPDPTLLAYLQGREVPDPELQQIVARLRQ